MIETISIEIRGPITPKSVGTAESLTLRCKRKIMIAPITNIIKKGIGMKFKVIILLLFIEVVVIVMFAGYEVELVVVVDVEFGDVVFCTIVSQVLFMEL
jgi:hypothetical protein